MNRSFNSNIRYRNKVYHIQTEIYSDHVVTQVFDGGRILHSLKTGFIDFKSTVQQHKSVERQVEQGRIFKE